MEENNRNYEYDDEQQQPAVDKSIKGYRMVICILAVILVAISGLYFKIHQDQKRDYQFLEIERDSIQSNLGVLMEDFDNLQITNDTISQNLATERLRADSLMQQLQKERTYNYNQLAKYKKEVETLRGVMKGYLRQIDSLNDINTDLQAKNVAYEKERSDYQERVEKAEEKAEELNTKVRIGSVIRTGGVRIVALNDNGKAVKRIKVASRLRVDFELTANELAEPGEKTIYVCITDPDGYVLSPADKMIPFTFEGEGLTASAMRKVSYENESVPVSIFYDGSAFQKGTYKVDIYIDGRHCGSGTTYFE